MGNPLKTALRRDRGVFRAGGVNVSRDGVNWRVAQQLAVLAAGLVLVTYTTAPEPLLRELQLCHVWILPLVAQQKRRLLKDEPAHENPVLYVKTLHNDKAYLRMPLKEAFVGLLAALAAWQNMAPGGLGKKWFCVNLHRSADPHELLVCRFKVYGPLPRGRVTLAHGVAPPLYKDEATDVQEGWFYAMGVLKLNGMLHFVAELDGSLLYQLNVCALLASEVRELHHSVCDSQNLLFVGQLRDLRWNNVAKSTLAVGDNVAAVSPPFLTRDGRLVPSNNRVYIEFPLHIDLEDWFVGLHYFAKREYIGVGRELSGRTSGRDSLREHLRVSKRLTVDIIEAKFDKPSAGKIYAEVVMWGYAWARTALVPFSANPFWKENFATDLPILTQVVHIVIRKTAAAAAYSASDKVIGTVYLTPDVLTQQGENSTMTVGQMAPAVPVPANEGNQIVRLSIYDSAHVPIGKLLLTVDLKEYVILPPSFFKPLENMLVSCPMKELIAFCNQTVVTTEFENVSFILLDIFQSLGVEERWFKALMDAELATIDKATRKHYAQKSTNNIFNTLFRGNLIFTKSLEKYIHRIGQEYLEKAFGNFFEQIAVESRNCEVDPRYVRKQLRNAKKGRDPLSSESDSDSDSDDEELLNATIEENRQSLLKYCEELWLRIYSTSNDLPAQIKTQLKNFRSKVDMACDPGDQDVALNCLSAFIFLRFFCPAILNPKLFSLTKTHQTGHAQRTLTMLAKVLLNLANRLEFSPHKEPHLVQLNEFLRKHNEEVLTYFDRITGRRNDFGEKVLELSHEVNRLDLGLEFAGELPTTPYLIDKYLRLTEFIHLLQLTSALRLTLPVRKLTTSSSNTSIGTAVSLISIKPPPKYDSERAVYQIGSLEFEKSEFLDLGDNETEFIKSLCRLNEEIFSFINSNISLKDLQKQSTNLINKIGEIVEVIEPPEVLGQFSAQWEAFVEGVVRRAVLDTATNQILYFDSDFQDSMVPGHKPLTELTLGGLRMRFEPGIVASSSSYSLASVLKPRRESLRRFFKK